MAGTTVTAVGDRATVDDGWVLVVHAGDDVRALGLTGRAEVVLGRERACDIALDHDEVSRRHARLVLGESWRIEDLGSRNGTRVRGDTLRGAGAELVPGEPFVVGPFTAVVLPRVAVAIRTAARAASLVIEDPGLDPPSPLLLSTARSAINVLIRGETGVGKEVLAAALHRLSGRAGPLLRLNCAAISPQLLESELFGHERGAFTGAVAAKPGLLEAAAGGTVLLDEIGEMAPELQAKLLRAIDAREVFRVGAVKPIAIDVRFVSSTHRELLALIDRGGFRRDLFYRIAGITLEIPRLRDRPARIAALASSFARGAGARLGASAVARLAEHTWPGNVRELRNVIDRAVLLAAGSEIVAGDIAFDEIAPGDEVRSADVAALTPAQILERDRIVAALNASHGNQTEAAKQIGLSRAALAYKLVQYRVPRPRDKA